MDWLSLLTNAELPAAGAGVSRLHELTEQYDLHELVARTADDRPGVLATLRKVGVQYLGDRQAIANALGRHRRGLPSTQIAKALPESVTLVVSINVHEHPNFVLKQLEHIREHIPFTHRVILNCNDEMRMALRQTSAAELCHPVALNKRRHHGSLLEGIMRNLEFALRRWKLGYFLILSSRSWFRRPLSLADVTESRAQPPIGAQCSDLRYERNRGLHWVDSKDDFELVKLQDGTIAKVNVDVSAHYRGTLLAQKLQREGHVLLHSPHEGLVLEHAACTHALRVLDSRLGRDLYDTETAVEEFALQSIAHSRGLYFAQLSDMGRPGGGHGLDATGDHLPPLTKTIRIDVPVDGSGSEHI